MDRASNRDDETGAIGAAGLRLDKWLWHARFCKSRNLAAKLCIGGQIRLAGQRIMKASHVVRPGDVLTFALAGQVRVVRVVALGVRRGPSPEARTLYEDMTPAQSRVATDGGPEGRVGQRPIGSGRPTKRDRRAIDRLVEED